MDKKPTVVEKPNPLETLQEVDSGLQVPVAAPRGPNRTALQARNGYGR